MNQPIRGRARLAAAVPGISAESRALAEQASAIQRVERSVPLERDVLARFDGLGVGVAPALTTGRNNGLMARWTATGAYVVTLGSAGLWLDARAHVVGPVGKSATVGAFDSDERTVSVLIWTAAGSAVDLAVGERLIVTVHELRSVE